MVGRYVGVLLLVLPLVSTAQTVYKCKGIDGKPVYQSFPCAGDVPPEKVWSGSYRQPTNAELWQRYHIDQRWAARQQSENARRAARSFYAAPSSSRSKSSHNSAACSTSRSEYSRVQADFKLNRNINLLRRIEADIYRYCEVRP